MKSSVGFITIFSVLPWLVAATDNSHPAIKEALERIADHPENYIYDLGDVGLYKINKAYFSDDNTFVFHHEYLNGIVTLDEFDGDTMVVEGSYQTDENSGSITLSLQADGSASGEWHYFFFDGPVRIINIRP